MPSLSSLVHGRIIWPSFLRTLNHLGVKSSLVEPLPHFSILSSTISFLNALWLSASPCSGFSCHGILKVYCAAGTRRLTLRRRCDRVGIIKYEVHRGLLLDVVLFRRRHKKRMKGFLIPHAAGKRISAAYPNIDDIQSTEYI